MGRTVQRSALCRSRRELSNAYLLAKIGVDTAENEPLEVWGENSIQYSLQSLERKRRRGSAVRAGADSSPALGGTFGWHWSPASKGTCFCVASCFSRALKDFMNSSGVISLFSYY